MYLNLPRYPVPLTSDSGSHCPQSSPILHSPIHSLEFITPVNSLLLLLLHKYFLLWEQSSSTSNPGSNLWNHLLFAEQQREVPDTVHLIHSQKEHQQYLLHRTAGENSRWCTGRAYSCCWQLSISINAVHLSTYILDTRDYPDEKPSEFHLSLVSHKFFLKKENPMLFLEVGIIL